MRLLRILPATGSIALGLVSGAVDPQGAVLDLGATTIHAGLGVAPLAAGPVGAVPGGLVLAPATIAPLRRDPQHAGATGEPRPPYDTGV